MNDETKATNALEFNYEEFKQKMMTIKFDPNGNTCQNGCHPSAYKKKLAKKIKQCLNDLDL